MQNKAYIILFKFLTKKYGLFQGSKRFLLKSLDLVYDIIYGTDTLIPIPLEELTIQSDILDSTDYQSTNIWQVKKLFANSLLKNPSEHTFVDVGCGKGKVLLEAAKHGFKKCIGIDFSDDLCRIAQKNSQIFQDGIFCDRIKIIKKDARHYKFDNDENLIFMFNPFGESSLKEVLNNIYNSLAKNPRKLLMIYHTPKYDLCKINNSFVEISNTISNNFKFYSLNTE